MSEAKRTPGDVLRESRARDSRTKRAKVLTAVDQMRERGDTITFASVARTAGVSSWLVYAEGVREHVEAAMKGQAKGARRTRQAGAGASAASLATDLALAREENKVLREENQRLTGAVRRGLGAQLDQSGTKELSERIEELLQAVERISGERDRALTERDELQDKLTETEENLDAARGAIKRLMRKVNTT
ncbi:DUF6262 family protein [Kitasatospora sp. NPDC050463]|uniref:DUF6262 family protein n=1 Tax=Kitasatospora sp. NPDC050463 TaxID=3155786 RepID=UPI003407CA65